MLYYAVTEGRARVLDRLRLRDRATYGLDWMVFEASSAGDAVRQWNVFKAGTHAHQGQLEREAASYRAGGPGYVAPWQAESEAVALRAAESLEAVAERRQQLREAEAGLDEARKMFSGVIKAASTARPRPRAKTRKSAKKTKAKVNQPRGSKNKPPRRKRAEGPRGSSGSRRRSG